MLFHKGLWDDLWGGRGIVEVPSIHEREIVPRSLEIVDENTRWSEIIFLPTTSYNL